MKKIYTIAAAMLLGGLGFSANALDVCTIDYTATPEDGETLTKNADAYEVRWDGNVSLAISESAADYFVNTWGDATFVPEMYVNDELIDEEGMVEGLIDYDDPNYEDPSLSTGPFLRLVYNGDNASLGSLPLSIKWVVPEGSVIVTSNGVQYLSQKIVLEYEIEAGVNFDDAETIEFDTPTEFTIGSKYKFFNMEDMLTFVVETNSDVNLIEAGTLTILNSMGIDAFQWSTYEEGEDGLNYTVQVYASGYYLISYSGLDPITLTLKVVPQEDDEPTGDFLPEPQITPADGETLYGWPENAKFSWQDEIQFRNSSDVILTKPDGTTVEIEAEITSNGYMDQDTRVPEPPYYLIVDWGNASFVDGATLPGVYTINVPEGLVVTEDGQVNEAIEVSYTLYAVKGWDEIIPDPNAMDDNWNPITYTAAQLAEVEVVFDYPLTAIANPPVVSIMKVGDDEGEGGGVEPHSLANGIVEDVAVRGNSIVLDLSEYELTDGTWVIEIPAGFAKINETTYTGLVEITYNVFNGLVYPTILGVENRAEYTTVNKPEYAVLTWDYQAIELSGEGEVTINVWDPITYDEDDITVKAADIELKSIVADNDGEGGVAPLADEEEVMNALQINLAPYLKDVTGNITVIIPEGFVTNGELDNAAQTIVFRIMPLLEEEPTFTLEENELTIEWEGYTAYWNWDCNEEAYVTDTEGNQIELPYGDEYSEDDDYVISPLVGEVEIDEDVYPANIGFIVDFSKIALPDESYTLWLPLGYASLYSEDQTESLSNIAYWQFDVVEGEIIEKSSGIQSIATDKAVEGVYNLQGVKMSNDLNSLAPGLYIINGKKVLIRK
ncbi:MAG: hypothetical protein J1E16_06015 [Muribaculaceae bacterium]|nr:hypothetical protein [Muribaculaceae bacterium]